MLFFSSSAFFLFSPLSSLSSSHPSSPTETNPHSLPVVTHFLARACNSSSSNVQAAETGYAAVVVVVGSVGWEVRFCFVGLCFIFFGGFRSCAVFWLGGTLEERTNRVGLWI
jgi:hypothetical protein